MKKNHKCVLRCFFLSLFGNMYIFMLNLYGTTSYRRVGVSMKLYQRFPKNWWPERLVSIE